MVFSQISLCIRSFQSFQFLVSAMALFCLALQKQQPSKLSMARVFLERLLVLHRREGGIIRQNIPLISEFFQLRLQPHLLNCTTKRSIFFMLKRCLTVIHSLFFHSSHTMPAIRSSSAIPTDLLPSTSLRA